MVPLSFWDFPAATQDGEDLKTEFRARIQEIESSLSLAQKKDIIQEAVEIMTQLLEVVREIDRTIREESVPENEKPPVPSMISSNNKPQDVEKTSDKEELAFHIKLLHLSMGAANEVLTRVRSFVSFAPGETPTVPVTVTGNSRGSEIATK